MKLHINKLTVLDCGKNEATSFDYNNKYKTIMHEEVLNLPYVLNRGDTLVIEYSHMAVPRTKKSLSQPFTKEQLLAFYKACEKNGIQLLFFPQKSTPSALFFSQEEILKNMPKKEFDKRKLAEKTVYTRDDLKHDKTDPMAIYHYIQAKPNLSLMKPPASFEASNLRKEGWERKKECTILCNQARADGNGKKLYSDNNSDWIRNHAIEISNQLSENAKSCFGLTISIPGLSDKRKNLIREELGIDPNNLEQLKVACRQGKISQLPGLGEKTEQSFLDAVENPRVHSKTLEKPHAIYAILSTLRGKVLDDDGNLSSDLYLRESTGELPGWAFVKRYVLGFSPYHLKGGTARSNIYHHSLKSWVRSQAEREGVFLFEGQRAKSKGNFSQREEEVFLKYRRIYSKSCKEVFIAIKSILES
jgi:hypothetical protein